MSVVFTDSVFEQAADASLKSVSCWPGKDLGLSLPSPRQNEFTGRTYE